MNLAKKIIYIFYILFFLNIFAFGTFAQQVKIIAKIDDEIITNMDVQNEYNYLITLMPTRLIRDFVPQRARSG